MPVSAMVQATTTSLTFVPLFAMDHLILRQTKSLSSSFVDLSYYGTHRTSNGRRGHFSATRTHGGGQLRTVPTIRKSTCRDTYHCRKMSVCSQEKLEPTIKRWNTDTAPLAKLVCT